MSEYDVLLRFGFSPETARRIIAATDEYEEAVRAGRNPYPDAISVSELRSQCARYVGEQ